MFQMCCQRFDIRCWVTHWHSTSSVNMRFLDQSTSSPHHLRPYTTSKYRRLEVPSYGLFSSLALPPRVHEHYGFVQSAPRRRRHELSTTPSCPLLPACRPTSLSPAQAGIPSRSTAVPDEEGHIIGKANRRLSISRHISLGRCHDITP